MSDSAMIQPTIMNHTETDKNNEAFEFSSIKHEAVSISEKMDPSLDEQKRDNNIEGPKSGSRKKAKNKINKTEEDINKFGGEEQDQYSARNLYIKGLPQSTTHQSLQNLFVPYGKIQSAKAIMHHESPHICKGFGFVMFHDATDALSALNALSQQGYSVTFAKIPRPRQTQRPTKTRSGMQEDPTNLYFSNLPLVFDEDKLKATLSPYGKVVSCRILRDYHTQLSRGVGFARMENRAVCEKVVAAFNGKKIEGCSEALQCKFADTPTHKRNWPMSPQDYAVTQQMNILGGINPNLYVGPSGSLVPMYSNAFYGMPMRISTPSPSPSVSSADESATYGVTQTPIMQYNTLSQQFQLSQVQQPAGMYLQNLQTGQPIVSPLVSQGYTAFTTTPQGYILPQNMPQQERN